MEPVGAGSVDSLDVGESWRRVRTRRASDCDQDDDDRRRR